MWKFKLLCAEPDQLDRSRDPRKAEEKEMTRPSERDLFENVRRPKDPKIHETRPKNTPKYEIGKWVGGPTTSSDA